MLNNYEWFKTEILKMTKTSLSNYDIIGVMGGTNDYWNSIEIGTINDKSTNTLYGCLNDLVEHLLVNASGKFIFLMTPIIGYRSSERISEGYASFPYPTNNKNLTLDDYCEAIRKVGEKYSIPVLDMKKNSGLCSLISSEDKRLYHDGIHPNSAGYEQIAKVVGNYLKTNYR